MIHVHASLLNNGKSHQYYTSGAPHAAETVLTHRQPKLDEQMAVGNLFAGTPDQVYEQIKSFWEYCGGFGHMLIMGQAGFLSDKDALKSMKLFSKEVYPRLRELSSNADPSELWEKSKAAPVKSVIDLGTFGVEFAR